MVVFQFEDDFIAIASSCPHEQANLAEGRFVAPFVLECPLHQNTYDLRTGAIKSFKVEMDGDKLYLLWKRRTNEPVAPTFSSVTALGERTSDERYLTLEREIATLHEAAEMRQRQVLETLHQMDGMIREVEEKRKAFENANAKAAAAGELIGRVMETMSEGLLVLDTQGRVKEVNRRFATLFGAPREELLQRPLDALFPSADADALHKATQSEIELEANVLSRDGVATEHLLRTAPLYGPSGKREGVVVVGTEISRIKAAQREVASAYEKISSLLNGMRQGVFVVLESGEIVAPVSRCSREIFGRDIVGANVFDVLYKDMDRAGEAFPLLETAFLSTFGSEDFQWGLMEELFPCRVLYRRGSAPEDIAVLKIEYTPLRDREGLMDRLMIIVDDVTKVELLEREKQHHERRGHILEELASNEPEDLRELFVNAYDLLRTARGLVVASSKTRSEETTQLLFRALHTLKGNMRMSRLSLIGQATHEAENLATFLREAGDDPDLEKACFQRLLEQLGIIQRQVVEYCDVAERLLHIPNDHEKRVTSELHRAMVALDSGLAHAPDGLRSAAVAHEIASLRETAEGLGCARILAELPVNRALGRGTSRPVPRPTEHGAKPPGWALAEAVIERLCSSNAFALYTLSRTTWSSLYNAAHQLTRAALRHAKSGGKTPCLDCERALEGALSAAGGLGHEYATALREDLARAMAAPADSTPQVVRTTLRELWRHLAFHSVCEGLATLQPVEREHLVEALRRGEQLDAIPTSTLTTFLQAQRQSGLRAHDVFATLGDLFEVTPDSAPTAGIASWFVSTGHLSDTKGALAVLDERLSPNAINTWLREVGGALEVFSTIDSARYFYLKRLDVIRLARTVRELMKGELQLLLDEVRTVEVMACRAEALASAVEALKSLPARPEYAPIQRAVEQLFYLPLLPAFSKYHAMVAEIAARLGKQVELRLTGDATLGVPKAHLARLQDALVHLFRNGLDHGLESPAERATQGKPQTGTLELSCFQRDSAVVIQLRDDGRGIDPARIRKKALELGVLTYEAASRLGPRETIELIFLPHFSTASDVTDISGRGIGMDIVRGNLQEIGAELAVYSELGRGSEFVITLKHDSMATPTNGAAERWSDADVTLAANGGV
jgi:PAS domain S-box-containing protein